VPYIHCPECNAIRTTDSAGCPECGRCANCGIKLAENTVNCECGFPADEKLAGNIVRHYGIPDEAVELEKSERERRKKMEPILLAARILLLMLCTVLGVVTGMVMLADKDEFTKVTIGMLVVCLSILFYWVFFIGIGKILMWLWKKVLKRQ
jgi:hypothetical protein